MVCSSKTVRTVLKQTGALVAGARQHCALEPSRYSSGGLRRTHNTAMLTQHTDSDRRNRHDRSVRLSQRLDGALRLGCQVLHCV